MRRAATLLQLPLFLAAQALGREDINYKPDGNYRPRNVTGLDYYYYPWIGSCVQLRIHRPHRLYTKNLPIGTTTAAQYSLSLTSSLETNASSPRSKRRGSWNSAGSCRTSRIRGRTQHSSRPKIYTGNKRDRRTQTQSMCRCSPRTRTSPNILAIIWIPAACRIGICPLYLSRLRCRKYIPLSNAQSLFWRVADLR